AVDVLWERGDRRAVLALERLWTELGREHPFVLVCGYDLRRFRHADLPALESLCALHGHELDAHEADVVAALEQRARVLETEIGRRERLEACMHRLLGVSGELSAARTVDAIARLAVEEGRSAVGAASSTMWLRAGDSLE